MRYTSILTVPRRSASMRSFRKIHWSLVSPIGCASTKLPKPIFHNPRKCSQGSGNYKAEAYDAQLNGYVSIPDMVVFIFVDEVFDNDHRIVSQRGTSSGKFTFIAHEAGDHKICFQPTHATTGGWLVGGQQMGTVKLTLDLAIGESSKIESSDKGKIQGIVQKVKDLNARLQDIRREQVFQRVRRSTS